MAMSVAGLSVVGEVTPSSAYADSNYTVTALIDFSRSENVAYSAQGYILDFLNSTSMSEWTQYNFLEQYKKGYVHELRDTDGTRFEVQDFSIRSDGANGYIYNFTVGYYWNNHPDHLVRSNNFSYHAVSKEDPNLASVTQLVAQTEANPTQNGVNNCRNSIATLWDSASKNALSARVDAIQASIDAETNRRNQANALYNQAVSAVQSAEGACTQDSINYARNLANNLPVNAYISAGAKSALGSRLDTVQANLNAELDRKRQAEALLSQATSAVQKAEGSMTQVDINSARSLVNNLPVNTYISSANKSALGSRLDKVQADLNAELERKRQAEALLSQATASVQRAESVKVQANVDSARTLVRNLPVNTYISATNKNSLNARLDAVQNSVNLENATLIVATAEQSRKREDILSARSSVNALVASDDKTSLVTRLANLEVSIATDSVSKAELSMLNTDIASARVSVGYLPDGDTKTNLVFRLDIVVAKNYIALASAMPNKDTITQAQEKINILPTGTARSTLQEQLNAVTQKLIYSVTKLVEVAEDSIKENIVNTDEMLATLSSAKQGVSSLLDGSEKDSLSKRLIELDKIVAYNSVKPYVDGLGHLSTDADIASVQAKVDTLSNDATRQKVLQDKINDIKNIIAKNIATAEEKVNALDITSPESEIQSAQVALDNIPVSPKKAELQSKLDSVHSNIQLYLVISMINSFDTSRGTLADIAKIQTELDKLPNTATKTKLQVRLDALQEGVVERDATLLVVKAEGSKLDKDISDAKEAVGKLVNDSTRIDLSIRLDAIIAEKDIALARENPNKDTITKAQSSINTLPSCTKKDDLQEQLHVINVALVTEVTNLVSKAEGTKQTSDITTAREGVGKLLEGDEKDALVARLSKLESDISYDVARGIVDKLTPSSSDDDIKKGQDAVNNVIDPKQKEELQKVLDDLKDTVTKNASNIKDGISKLVPPYSDKDIKDIQELIDKLPKGKDKDDLQAELDAIKQKYAEQEATKAVEKAESTKSSSDYDSAKTLVDALPDSKVKEALIKRLDTLVDNSNTKTAEELVNKLTPSSTQDDIKKAQDAVSKLVDGDSKKELQDKIDKIKEEIEKVKEEVAKNITDITDKIKGLTPPYSPDDIKNLQDLIDKLPDGNEKAELQAQLDEIKQKYAEQEATKLVVKAEESKSGDDYAKARDAVSDLKDGDVKTELVERLDKLNTTMSASDISARIDALTPESPSEEIQEIQNEINKLPQGADRDELQRKLDDFNKATTQIKADIAVIEAKLKDLDTAVTSGDTGTASGLVSEIQALIDKLPNCPSKSVLQDKLNVLDKTLNDIVMHNNEGVVATAQEAIVKAIDTLYVSNSTTSEELTKIFQNVVPSSVLVSVTDFKNNGASYVASGSVSGNIVISYNGATASVQLGKDITKLVVPITQPDTPVIVKPVEKHSSSSSSSSSHSSSSSLSDVTLGFTNKEGVSSVKIAKATEIASSNVTSLGLLKSANADSYTWEARRDNVLVNSGNLSVVTDSITPLGVLMTANSPVDTDTDVSIKVSSMNITSLSKLYVYNKDLGLYIPSVNKLVTKDGSVTFKGTNSASYLLVSDTALFKNLGVLGWNKFKDSNNDWGYTIGDCCITGWKQDGSNWYYLDKKSKRMVTGWLKSETNNWYFLNRGTGAMRTGWLKDGVTWYNLDGSGAMQTGWKSVDGDWYYFDESGAMLHDTQVSGYSIGSDGRLV